MKTTDLSMFTLLLISLLAVCPGLSTGNEYYDFFFLVLEWPASHCNTGTRRCCKPEIGEPHDNDFGIHGLWPNFEEFSRRDYPSFCSAFSPFDILQLQRDALLDRMLKHWPAWACGDKYGFGLWAIEWSKHGTCSQRVLNQYDYFRSAVDRKERLDILRILNAAGIRPGGGTYRTDGIRTAIQSKVGYPPGIQCNRDRNNRWQLYRIFLCVDQGGASLKECRRYPENMCEATTIAFPTFPPPPPPPPPPPRSDAGPGNSSAHAYSEETSGAVLTAGGFKIQPVTC